MSAGRQQLGSQQASADLRGTSTQERSAVACLTAAGGRVASCARRQRVGSEGRWAWRVAVRGRAHSQSIAEQGDSHRSGEGGSMGMLQNRSMSGARVGEGSASESPATREEPSGARWLTPGDIRRAVARCPTKRRSREREGSRQSGGSTFSNVRRHFPPRISLCEILKKNSSSRQFVKNNLQVSQPHRGFDSTAS